jgi:3-hydroxyisobutyrate dehydrogenase-like beta-hydroxyacid dehydrogenase
VANEVELERYVTVLRNFATRPMANPADRLLELLHDGWDTTGRTGRVGRLHEDLGFCLTIGRDAGVPLPLTERAVQLLDGAVAAGLAGEGPSSMAKLFPVASSEQLDSR